MNFLQEIIAKVVPYMISILEIIGIVIVFYSGIRGFWQYIRNIFKKMDYDLQRDLAYGLAIGLQFKMAAEILRTVLIQSLDELYRLGAIILLRALLSLLIYFELRHPKKASKSKDDNE